MTQMGLSLVVHGSTRLPFNNFDSTDTMRKKCDASIFKLNNLLTNDLSMCICFIEIIPTSDLGFMSM